MIQHTAFKHGWFYHYRVHREKLRRVSQDFPELENYLTGLFNHCPDEYFTQGPRSSKLTLPVEVPLQHVPGHEVCSMARFGLEHGRFKTAHSNVQVTMLENDRKTLAVEVPLWMLPNENSFHTGLFSDEHPLTGHIDVLSVENDLLWVWDYKPGARKEQHAHTQTYFYAVMLSQRTGIPLERIRCGYFDETDCYVFPPSAAQVMRAEQ